jgi:hypothetical protein
MHGNCFRTDLSKSLSLWIAESHEGEFPRKRLATEDKRFHVSHPSLFFII